MLNLEEYFPFPLDDFQLEAIRAINSGNSVVLTAPTDSGKTLIYIDPKYYRPTEVECLLGDPTKANKLLGWRHTTSIPEWVREMVAADLALMARERRINSE